MRRSAQADDAFWAVEDCSDYDDTTDLELKEFLEEESVPSSSIAKKAMYHANGADRNLLIKSGALNKMTSAIDSGSADPEKFLNDLRSEHYSKKALKDREKLAHKKDAKKLAIDLKEKRTSKINKPAIERDPFLSEDKRAPRSRPRRKKRNDIEVQAKKAEKAAKAAFRKACNLNKKLKKKRKKRRQALRKKSKDSLKPEDMKVESGILGDGTKRWLKCYLAVSAGNFTPILLESLGFNLDKFSQASMVYLVGLATSNSPFQMYLHAYQYSLMIGINTDLVIEAMAHFNDANELQQFREFRDWAYEKRDVHVMRGDDDILRARDANGNFYGAKEMREVDVEDLEPEILGSEVPPEDLRNESLSETLDWFNGSLDKILDSNLVHHLRNIITRICSFHYFSKDITKSIYKTFGKPTSCSVLEAMKSILSSITQVIKAGEMYMRGIPLSEIFFKDDPVQHCLDEGATLLRNVDNLYYGLPVEGKMCANLFMRRCTQLRNDITDLLPKISKFSTNHRRLTDFLIDLNRAHSSIQNTIRAASRIAPYAFCIYGEPGVGKSTVLQLCIELFCKVKGWTFNHNLVFKRDPSTDFWDGYDPESTPFIHYSELGSLGKEIAKRTGDPFVKELCSVIDSLPYYVNMAKLEDKGAVPVMASCVAIDTNNPNLNAPESVNNPSAVYRRFTYIEVKVKPEYMIGGTTMLDPKSGGPFYDKWTYKVSKRRPIGNRQYFEEVLLDHNDSDPYKSLCRLLMRDIREHIARQENNKDNLQNPDFRWMDDDDSEFPFGEIDEDHDDVKYSIDESDSDSVSDSEPLLTNCGHLNVESRTVSELTAYDYWTDLKFAGKCLMESATQLGRMFSHFMSFLAVVFASVEDKVKCGLLASFFLLLYYFGLVVPIGCISLGIFLSIDTKRFVKDCVDKEKRKLMSALEESFSGVLQPIRKLAAWWRGEFFLSHYMSSRNLAVIAGILGFIGVLGTLYSRKKKTNEQKSEASIFMNGDDADEKLNEFEDEYNFGKSYVRHATKHDNVWTTRHVPTSTHTGRPADLNSAISRNVRRVKITTGDKVRETYILGLKGGYILFNEHAMNGMGDKMKMRICTNMFFNGPYLEVEINREKLVRICTDIVMLQTTISFKDIIKHFPNEIVSFENAPGFVAKDSVMVRSYDGAVNVDSNDGSVITYDHTVQYIWQNHGLGKCGTPVVAQRDKGTCIVGIHCAGSDSTGVCHAAVITQPMLKEAFATLMASYEPMVHSESGLTFGDEPHPRSPVLFEDIGAMEYFGGTGVQNINQTSQLRKSALAGCLDDIFGRHLNFIPTTQYVRPIMKPTKRFGTWNSPWNVFIRKLSKTKPSLDEHLLARCENEYVEQVLKNLGDVPKLQPLDVESAINSVPYDDFLRRIDMSTAAGYGLPGKKKEYVIKYEVDGRIIYEPTSEIKSALLEILNKYANGNTAGPVFKICLKDEPRAIEKVTQCSTRPFASTTFPYLVAQRIVMAPLYTLMIERSEAFYTALGTDMHRDAHHIRERLVSFSDFIKAGDYSRFDTDMPPDVAVAVMRIKVRLLRALGYDESQVFITKGFLTEDITPTISVLGDIFRVRGYQPSGKYGTAEDNSIRNVLTHMYVYYASDPRALKTKFFDKVYPIVYGDDDATAIKPDVIEFFNSVTYARTLKEHFDMTYTTPTKGEVHIPYVDIDEVDFLKRKFVYHKTLKRYVGALDMNSVYKSLQWYLPSKSENEIQQLCQTVNSNIRELFLHIDDEKLFTSIRNELVENVQQAFPGVVTAGIHEWGDIYASLCSEIEPRIEGREVAETDTDLKVESSDLLSGDSLSNRYVRIRDNNRRLVAASDRFGHLHWLSNKWPPKIYEIDFLLNNLRSSLQDDEKELDGLLDPMPGFTWREILTTPLVQRSGPIYESLRCYHRLKTKVEATKRTISMLEQKVRRLERMRVESRDVSPTFDLKVESGELNEGPVDLKTVTDNENVIDIGGEEKDVSTIGESTTLDTGQLNLMQMDDFFERPVKIATITGTVGSHVRYSVDIWDAFLSNPTVRAKLRNWAYLSGTLVVRVAVSGSPFHYGMLQVSYQPKADFNANIPSVESDLASARDIAGLCYLSQAPGCRNISVRENRPLEMRCEFINQQPMIRLFNDSPLVLASAGSYNDAVGFGKLYINSINTVECAASTPSNISIFVYVTMEDVKLGCGTGTVIDITSESKIYDERETGPIENMASKAAGWSTALTAIPEIAPFAEASSMFFSGVSSVASLFGWSVPTMINEPDRVKNEPYQNGANTIGYDTGKRIVLDPKQELSVDPRDCGTSTDDMSLSAITSRESLLDVFTWATSDAELSTSIWMVPINPFIGKRFLISTPPNTYHIQPTALMYAATLFEFWRGDIEFRFEIVCSQYHRGKLAFYYEPNIAQNVAIDTSLDLNKQYIKIVDIQETQDMTFVVNWASSKAWLRVMDNSLIGDLGAVQFLGEDLFDYANGYMAVVPFTALQSPDGSDIQINVYISSKNMKFNYMTEARYPTSRLSVESRDVGDIMDLNESSASMSNIADFHFGEIPLSFRGLGKRFTTYYENTITGGGAGNPYYYVATDIWQTPAPSYTTALAAADPRNLVNYFRYAYLGFRGGLRHRVGFNGDYTLHSFEKTKIRLLPPSLENTATQHGYDSSISNYKSSISGTVEFIPDTNGGVEFETPMYTNNLFGLSFSDDMFPPGDTNVNPHLLRRMRITFPITSTSTSINHVREIALAEDSSFMRFQGAPRYTYVD